MRLTFVLYRFLTFWDLQKLVRPILNFQLERSKPLIKFKFCLGRKITWWCSRSGQKPRYRMKEEGMKIWIGISKVESANWIKLLPKVDHYNNREEPFSALCLGNTRVCMCFEVQNSLGCMRSCRWSGFEVLSYEKNKITSKRTRKMKSACWKSVLVVRSYPGRLWKR